MYPSGKREWHKEQGLATGLNEETSRFFIYHKEAEGLLKGFTVSFSLWL